MLTNKKGLSTVALTVTLLLTTSSVSSHGLKSEMDALFNDMTTATSPGVFNTQRRGVLAGGRFTTKSKIMNESLVTFVPPSWKAGCGGVDLFGGSLSFINSDQIVNLLRAVAANAKGYAFQLALDNVFPAGSKWIENFQKKIQELNQYLGNSCQLAQSLVDGATSGMAFKSRTDMSITAITNGLYDDMFGATQTQDGSSAVEKVKTNTKDEYEKMIGNIVWKQLKENHANSWFTYGDNELLEAIMSMTGTVIINDLVDSTSGGVSSKTNPITTLKGNKVKLAELMSGDKVTVYSCGSDTTNCLKAGAASGGTKKIRIKGLKDQIEEILLGTPSRVGVISRFANNSGTLSDDEKRFMASLPVGIGSIIRNLSVVSQDASELFAVNASGAVALYMTYDFVNQLYGAASVAIKTSRSPYKGEVDKVLAESQANLRAEFALLQTQYGDLSQQITSYNNLLKNVRKQRYMTASLNKPSKMQE